MKAQKEANADELRAALEEANLPTLLMALAQLTGDERWLRLPTADAPKGAGDHDSGGFREEVQAEIREEALEA